jgi:hypothetical protein
MADMLDKWITLEGHIEQRLKERGWSDIKAVELADMGYRVDIWLTSAHRVSITLDDVADLACDIAEGYATTRAPIE